MTAVGATERPDTVFLIEWTDIFGKERKALSLQKRDLESMRTVDPKATITEGNITWVAMEER